MTFHVPFPMAVEAGGLVWLSGHAALDLATGEVLGGTVAEQAAHVFAAMERTLGGDLGGLVRVECFLADLSYFADWDAAFAARFPAGAPARTTLIASPPMAGLLLEVQGVALAPQRKRERP